MKKLLAIDTTTAQASYALTDGDATIVSTRSDVREHATFILEDIDKLLQQLNLKIGELDGIAFGMGPGSFTGLRVACMVAKGLAYPHKLPLLGVCSLTSMLDFHNQYPTLACLDARMQQVYWQFQSITGLTEPKVANINDINLATDVNFDIIHYNCQDYLQELPARLVSCVRTIHFCTPDANMLLQSVQKGNYKLFNSITAEPLYVRNDIAQKT
jgi:tRNA threonylcarbamoyladenosine biosynthesis protein TsaB